jgi:hypothetical protein
MPGKCSAASPVRVTVHESMFIICLSQLFYVNKTPETCVDCQLRDLREVAVNYQQNPDLANCTPLNFNRKPASMSSTQADENVFINSLIMGYCFNPGTVRYLAVNCKYLQTHYSLSATSQC